MNEKIKPQDWNNLISDKETILIDVRNNFEVEMGTFKNSINPNTKSFTEFKSYIKNNLNKSKSIFSISNLPASIFEKSRMSLISTNSPSALPCATSAKCCC